MESIRLSYKLDGPVSLVLAQPDIKSGDEFVFDLPQAQEYTELVIRWTDFYQPDWISNKSELDMSSVAGMSFQIRTRHGGVAKLGIHAIKFFKIPSPRRFRLD